MNAFRGIIFLTGWIAPTIVLLWYGLQNGDPYPYIAAVCCQMQLKKMRTERDIIYSEH